jgi:hypothetical protein
MSTNKLYCIIADKDTGRWFGLDRNYSLLIQEGNRLCGDALRKEFPVSETDLGSETGSAFFPSEEHNAPKWAWYVKAAFGAKFRTTWIREKDESERVLSSGATVGKFLLESWVDHFTLKSGRFLAL